MAVDIKWSNIVGAGTVDDGGYVGDLMTIASAHIQDAMVKQQITQAQAGEIYTAIIPSAFQNGMGFELQKTDMKHSLNRQLLDTQLGAWTSIFNSGKADNVPDMVSNTSLEAQYALAQGA